MKHFLVALTALASLASLASRAGLIAVSTGGIVAFFAGCVISRILYIAIYPFWFSPLRHLPTPEGSNVITGHALKLLLAPSPYTYTEPWARKWPDAPFIRSFSFGNAEVVIPTSLEAFKAIVKTHAYDMDKSPELKAVLKSFIGEGLVFANGETHKRLRRVVAGPISKPSIRTTFSMMQTCAAEMTADLHQIIEGSSDGVLDIQEFFNKVTLEIAGLVITGERIGNLRSRDKGLTFEQCYKRILSPDPIGVAITFLEVWIPLRWLPIKANRDHFEADREIRSMIRDLIDKRRAEAFDEKTEGKLLSSRRDVLSKTVAANLNDKFISDKELMDTLVQFIVAGHETIARALAWLMSEFVRHPEVVVRLRQEVAEARAKQPDLDSLTVEGLPYLHNVIREGLRLYTTATLLSWQATRDVVVEGVAIPRGTLVHLIPRLMNRNHAVWGKDADEFNPDRWDHLNEYSGDAFAFQTFLNGPRICPGIPLVMLEMRVLCLELVENFDFELADPNKVITDCHPAISLKIRDGLPLRFRRRAAA